MLSDSALLFVGQSTLQVYDFVPEHSKEVVHGTQSISLSAFRIRSIHQGQKLTSTPCPGRRTTLSESSQTHKAAFWLALGHSPEYEYYRHGKTHHTNSSRSYIIPNL